MIKFDFNKYMDKFLDKEGFEKYLRLKGDVLEKFSLCEMTGWTREIDKDLVNRCIELSKKVKANSECLVVIGIGGSFLGSLCVNEMMGKYFNNDNFKVIYAGTTLSSKYMDELLEYLRGVDFSVNVISKSGTTMETKITYELIKDLMKEKYSDSEIKERIIVTTDKSKGLLREEVNEVGYESFIIEDDIGGRYSIVTPAHLFPLAFNIDLDKFIEGIHDGKDLINEAYTYSVIRRMMFDSGKVVENYVVYEQNMYYFAEWLKQLFGESEGKEGMGCFPVSSIHTRDLHSLGQFIQEGNKIIFETFFKVEKSNLVNYKNSDLHSINNIVLDSVEAAHFKGNVPCNLITIDEVNEYNIGKLMYFFMMSAAFSSLLFEVDPFNQPGVEVYKQEVRDNLKLD